MLASLITLISQILMPALVPGFGCTLLLVVAWRAWRRADRFERGHWGLALALPAAFLVAFVSQAGMPSIPPASRWHWIAVVVGLAAPPALVAALVGHGREWAVRLLLAWAVAVPAGFLVSLPLLDEPRDRLLIAAGAGVLALLLETLAARRPGPAVPAALMLAFTALSVAALEAGFAKLSLTCAGPSAACGAALVTALLNPRFSAARGGAAAAAAALVLLAATGHAYNYGEFDRLPWVIAALGPLALWLFEIPGLAGRDGWRMQAARIAVAAVPALLAIGLVLTAGGGDGGGGGGSIDDYGSFG